MNLTQGAMLAGGLIGLGAALVIGRFVPVQPDLSTALRNLAPEQELSGTEPGRLVLGPVDQVGTWAARHAPLSLVSVPAADLALLGTPLSTFYGQKVLYAVFGLAFPPLLSAMLLMLGTALPVAVPVIGSLVLAVALSAIPDYNARSEAAKARQEFTRALGAYIDLVALERISGAGPRQSMESAAAIGDSWPFRRIAAELARSRWSGVPPWEALSRLGAELEIPMLGELADIMRLSGEEGSAVYQMLRARSSALRSQLVSADLAEANQAGERLTLPGAVLAMSFGALVTAPALFRLLTVG